MIEEFKKFAVRGSMMDLAIGVVIGAAFTSIVNSFVTDLFMPIFGLVFGTIDFSKHHLGSIAYGKFLNSVIQFVIVAIALFVLIKWVNKLRGEPQKVENKLCRFCKTSIPKDATRCPFCTSALKES